MQLTELLLACLQPQSRQQAEQQLEEALKNHSDQYFDAIVNELADEAKPEQARQLAGLQLKNALYGKSTTTNKAHAQR